MVILKAALIIIGTMCSIASIGFTVNLARAKQTHCATIGGVLTVILIASLIGCSTLVQ